jgi:hypothetical protein
MNIVAAIKIINEMLARNVIENYALGGALAVTFYTEPIATQDVDIFFQVKEAESDLMILAPIYDYLTRKGYAAKAEHIIIEGLPIQFLPVFNDLMNAAVENANEFELEDTTIRVMSPEYLAAIMLDTGRTKDYLRIEMFLQNDLIDFGKLEKILRQHDLSAKWEANKHRLDL